MMKQFSMIGAALAMTAGATIAAAPANAQYYGDRGYSSRDYYRDGYAAPRYSDRRAYDRAYQRGYANRGYYNDNRRYYGRNSYSYRCSNGTAGTVLGAIVGGLLGDAAVGRRGDGTAGAIVGAGVGALAGRAIERSSNRC
jgi:hypothetical protein